MVSTPPAVHPRLQTESIIWFGSVRPDGRPHLVPLWFVWHAEKMYICIDLSSVKGRNVQQNANVVLALEDGMNAVICEGTAMVLPHPWPPEVIRLFYRKYDWDIMSDDDYANLLEIAPKKWFVW